MTSQQKMIEQVDREVRLALPDFPIVVQPSADDEYVLCVRIFAVPRAEVERLENVIFELEERLLVESRYILLPMVKNLEVTRQYYPEHLPPPVSPVVAEKMDIAILEAIANIKTNSVTNLIGIQLPAFTATKSVAGNLCDLTDFANPNKTDADWQTAKSISVVSPQQFDQAA